MNQQEFEDRVSHITDRYWSTLNRRACYGVYDSIPVVGFGVEAHSSDTREALRSRIRIAARLVPYNILIEQSY